MYENCFYKTVCTEECTYEEGCSACRSMNFLLRDGEIPRAMRHPHKMQPQPCDEKAFKQLYDIASNIVDFVDDGRVLYIHSDNPGNGKTTWAVRMLLNYFDWAKDYYFEELVGAFVNVPEFLVRCKAEINLPTDYFQQFHRNLFKCRLLVLDDISIQSASNYDISVLYSIINYRELNNLSIIYTSNISPKDLYKYVDARLASRINTQNRTTVIEFRGKDER